MSEPSKMPLPSKVRKFGNRWLFFDFLRQKVALKKKKYFYILMETMDSFQVRDFILFVFVNELSLQIIDPSSPYD